MACCFAEDEESEMWCTPETPWVNTKAEDGSVPSGEEQRAEFLDVLRHRLVGARLNTQEQLPNIYPCFGYASQVPTLLPTHR